MIPEGRLVRSRVVRDAATALEDALDRRLTGYAVLEPRDALLGDGDGQGLLTFDGGVPVLAYHSSERSGPAALAAIATPGPYRLQLYELAQDALADAHRNRDLEIAPGAPAQRLAGDADLADRTRRVAPDDRLRPPANADRDDLGAVEAFLADEERVAAIRKQARAEARRRAHEWGFADVGPSGLDSHEGQAASAPGDDGE